MFTPDSGYSWVILAVNFVSEAIGFGVAWSVGVFFEMFLNLEHGSSRGEVGLICSINTAAFYAIGK